MADTNLAIPISSGKHAIISKPQPEIPQSSPMPTKKTSSAIPTKKTLSAKPTMIPLTPEQLNAQLLQQMQQLPLAGMLSGISPLVALSPLFSGALGFGSIRKLAEQMSAPIRTEIALSRPIIDLSQALLGTLAVSPVQNPFLNQVINAFSRQMEEEVSKSIEQFSAQANRMGAGIGSAIPQQARLLRERALQTLGEQVSRLMYDIFERQRAIQLQSIGALLEIPRLRLGLAEAASRLPILPEELLLQRFHNLGSLFGQLQTGITTSQVVQPSLASRLLTGIGTGLGLMQLGSAIFGGAPATSVIAPTPIAPSPLPLSPLPPSSDYLGFRLSPLLR